MLTNDRDEVVEWMIATIWTDDVRYFGTSKMLDDYEQELQKHIKVKLLGVPGEFVGVEIKQDLERGLLEMILSIGRRHLISSLSSFQEELRKGPIHCLCTMKE